MILEYQGLVIKQVGDGFHVYRGERLVTDACESVEDAKDFIQLINGFEEYFKD